MPKLSRLLPALVLFCLGMVFGETLNRTQIHHLYTNGDFDQVISQLEGFMNRNKTYDRDDSVFIAKHLAVVYSANPATREKGKYYMVRLLELVPSAKLVDMYVSDEIDHIFDHVKEEYMTREEALGKKGTLTARNESGSENSPPKNSQNIGAESKPSHTVYWLAAGGAVLAGLTAFYFLHQDSQPTDKVYAVP